MTGGHVAAPMFANFMKMALADKKAVPFRIPPGIKLVRVSLRTGLRAQGGERDTVTEAFKPIEEPDDAYSIIGFTDERGGFFTGDQIDAARRDRGPRRLLMPNDCSSAARAAAFTVRWPSPYISANVAIVHSNSASGAAHARRSRKARRGHPPVAGAAAEASLTGIARAARLAELNKRAEDPNLWSNPQAAQKVMRQRQALERSIAGYKKLERELDDAVTLIELGESEDDEASIEEGEARLRKLAEEARRQEVEALLSGEADGNDTYLEVHAGAGGTESQDWAEHAVAHVHALGRGARLQGVAGRAERRRGGRHQVGDAADQGRERLRLAQDRVGRAPAGAHLALRQQRAPAHQLCQRLGLSGGRRQHRDRHQGERLPHRHLSRLGRRRPARQHHRLGGAHHAHARPTSWWRASRSARRSRTAPSPGPC